MRSFRFLLLAGAVLSSVQCQDQATLAWYECSAHRDCDSGLCLDGRCVEPVDATTDLPAPSDADAAVDQPSDTLDSVIPPDMPTDRPVENDLMPDGDLSDSRLLGFGEPCTANSQCESRYCIDFGEMGRICTRECAEDCVEEGFTCRLITNTGSDATWLCVPERDVLCQPCEYDTDCGGFGNFCLQQDDGTFCATDCTLTRECPAHYVCNGTIIPGAGPEGEDLETYLCEPNIHNCSGCVDNDGDGYGAGWTCLGSDCDDIDELVHPDAPERCNYQDDDCDRIADDGIDLMTSLDHCGECNSPCHPEAHEVTECEEGECLRECEQGYWNNDPLDPGCEYPCTLNPATSGVEICNFADDDCDGIPDDGFDVQNDPAFCGDCTPCDLPHSDTHECVRGECRPLLCDSGWAHCDEDYTNGCEQDVWYDVLNCGNCDYECEFDNAAPLCGPSGCYFVECASTDYANCNSIQEDGCEVDLTDDPVHCDSCDHDCHDDHPHAEVTCEGRTCIMGECVEYYYDLREDLAGCEYGPCYGSPTTVDLPDSTYLDADCDGIDGDIERAVFVAPAPAGDDGSTTCSMSAPCATIGRALTVAVSRGASQVLLRAGSYSGVLDLGSTHNGIGIYGGYNSTWQRGDRDTVGFETTIVGAQHTGDQEYLTVRARSVTATMANIRLSGPNASGRVNDNGRSAYVIHAANATLSIRDVTFLQGNGVAGLAGAGGTNYSSTPAPAGNPGGDNHEGFSVCDDSWGGSGGTGASNCSATEARGGNGGTGGKKDTDCDWWEWDWDATAGNAGSPAGWSQTTSPYYGRPGGGGKTCEDGGTGYNGRNGSDGGGGIGGTSGGTLYTSNGSLFWTARDGNAGLLGSHGTGGGGGGGGGGCDSGNDSDGAGGGGGGAGGCRAPSAGQAGNGGGGSFGIFATNSTLTVVDCEFVRGTAGSGGTGGNGGRGQTGGAAGQGGGGQGEGHGGDGGSGGRGGHSGGGGGGAGGFSHGIYTYSSSVSQSGNTFDGGAYGTGGSGGTSDGPDGTAGANGVLGTVGVFSY